MHAPLSSSCHLIFDDSRLVLFGRSQKPPVFAVELQELEDLYDDFCRISPPGCGHCHSLSRYFETEAHYFISCPDAILLVLDTPGFSSRHIGSKDLLGLDDFRRIMSPPASAVAGVAQAWARFKVGLIRLFKVQRSEIRRILFLAFTCQFLSGESVT